MTHKEKDPGANQRAFCECGKFVKNKHDFTSPKDLKSDLHRRILSAGELGIKKVELDDRFVHLGWFYMDALGELCDEALVFIAYRKDPGTKAKKTDYVFAL